MPTPKRNETEQEFVSRCVPVVIEDQGLNAGDEGQRRQAVAICYSMWRQAKKEGESMNDNMTMTHEDLMANVTVKEGEHKDTIHIEGEVVGQESSPYSGATSFEEILTAREAQEAAYEIENYATMFRGLVSNILASPEIENKEGAISKLATEFASLVKKRMGETQGLKSLNLQEWMSKASKFLMGDEMTFSTEKGQIVNPVVGVIAVDVVDNSAGINTPAFLTTSGPATRAFVRSFVDSFTQPIQITALMGKDAATFSTAIVPIRSEYIIPPLEEQLTATGAFNEDFASSLSPRLVSVPSGSTTTRTKASPSEPILSSGEFLAAIITGSGNISDASTFGHNNTPSWVIEEYYTTKCNRTQVQTAFKTVWTRKYINNLPDSSFLYVEPGDKDGEGKTVPRSKRHFPYKDAGGKVDLPHLRNAIARIPQSNAPGLSAAKKQSLQERARRMLRNAQGKETGGSLLDKVISAVKSAFTWEPEPDSDLMLWKEGDRWRWLAVFSNKYRDRDNPPEILASFAHKEFVAAVDAGDWPMPELRHWHVPGTRWGTADWLAYDEDTGFTLASGWIDKEHEKEAEATAHSSEPIKVSHGMPIEEIRRDKDDPTVIVRYRTAEISDLPAWAAANPLTGFHIIEQEVKGMSLPNEKKDYLLSRGLTEEQVDAIEADLASKAKAADELGLEHKESDEPPESGETAESTGPQEETPGEEDQPEYVTRTEIETAMKEFSQTLRAEFDALHEEIAGLKQSDEKKVAKALRSTPAASLAQMMVAQLKGEPIGVPVKDGEKIKGPEETPHDQEQGIPVLTALMGGGDWRKAMGIPEGGNNTS